MASGACIEDDVTTLTRECLDAFKIKSRAVEAFRKSVMSSERDPGLHKELRELMKVATLNAHRLSIERACVSDKRWRGGKQAS